MESASDIAVSVFGKAGRCYGLFIRIRGRVTILGATERGIFYRIGVKITETKPGQWNGFFGLRTRIGIGELMIKKWMKDEVVPLKFGPSGVRGSLHFSHTGIISFIGGSLANHRGNSMAEIAATADNEVKEGDTINSHKS